MSQYTGTIRERVEVRPHATVVRLDDLSAEGSQWLTESFVLTKEVSSHLNALRGLLARDMGCGVFLIGHYGCGKSHFLAYFIQRLLTGDFSSKTPKVAYVSLVNFSAENRLEEIVTQSLGVELQKGDRRSAWKDWFTDHSPNGRVLVLDELSEFLRSKPDARSFTEDVRFLQFMGEWAQGERFWIVAAMQEAIEHTGELEYSLYRKIKDRYPLRLLLTPAHVKSLISDSILIKKDGYDHAVERLVAQLRESFPAAQLDESLFKQIYPLHPATLELLEEVRDRFSQARGVVDFTVARLRGDPARNISAFLDEPWGSLLTPDLIVDHFHDLFAIQPEFMPLAQQVLPWYEKNLQGLFDKPALRRLSKRLVGLLILVHLSPARESLSVKQAAEWLLFSTIRTDPAKNQAVVQRVLSKLAEQGRYVTETKQCFRLNLEDSGRQQLDNLLAREVDELTGQDLSVLETLAPLIPAQGLNPFLLPRNQWQRRQVLWHFHTRAYSIWFGETQPSKPEGLCLAIRLPWGEKEAIPGMYSLEPAHIIVSQDMIELAALVRLQERPLSPEWLKLIKQRMEARTATFQSIVLNAWSEATLINPEGRPETPPRLERKSTLDVWLESLALWILRRTYPAFERYAPSHGPLPKEAWLQFMRFATEEDLGRGDADDSVRLIREAYLVPMGLMRRVGRDYVQQAKLEKHELVRLLMPLVEHGASPRTIHQHFAQPIYGLVPDQINLLLVFLLIQGEIDIVKGSKSYREAYETLSNPLQYDRVELGSALAPKQLEAMKEICAALNIALPKQWTVLAQRRVVAQLREIGRCQLEALSPLLANLESIEQGRNLVERIKNHLQAWNRLSKGENDLQGFEHFHYELGSLSGFLDDVRRFSDLPERLPRLVGELQRFQHLLNHPAIAEHGNTELVDAARGLGTAPNLDEVDALDDWLNRARNIYARYKQDYQLKHQKWWEAQADAPIWSWRVPAIAGSKHLGLADDLVKMQSCKQEAEQQRCRKLVNLDYQPLCSCGFDGETAPIAVTLKRFETQREDLDAQLRLFFQQDDVKLRIKDWQQQGFELTNGTASYLEGRRPVPDIQDIGLFDKHLAGLKLAQEVEVSTFMEIFAKRVWEPAALLQALGRELGRFQEQSLRFVGFDDRQDISDEIASWFAQQCLNHGVVLPELPDRHLAAKISQVMCPEWVSAKAVVRLEHLGLDQTGQDTILSWLLNGKVALPEVTVDPNTALFAVREFLQPSCTPTAEGIACISESLYRYHKCLYSLAGQPWLDRLDALAESPLPDLPSLPELLKNNLDAQWLLLDCFGLPLLGPIKSLIDELFGAWQPARLNFAKVDVGTTTDSCYRELLDGQRPSFIPKMRCYRPDYPFKNTGF